VRAIRVHELGGPEVLRVEPVDDPSAGDGELLVRLHAIGVNPVEGYVRSGIGLRPQIPYTPGSDGAGVVVAVGEAGAAQSGAAAPQPGDRVYVYGSLTGTYAELALCRPEQVFPLPPALSFEEGAALGVPYGTAFRALVQLGRVRQGETVLVHGGSGSVGLATVQIAADRGALVIASASTEEGRRLALAQGAAHAVDHTDPAHFAEVLGLTGNRGVDVIAEMRSDLNLGADLRLLAHAGRVVCVGNRGPDNEGAVTVDARDLMRRDGAVLGMILPPAGHPAVTALHEELRSPLAERRFAPVVSATYPLEQAEAVHRRLADGHSLGKLVLVP
jgi:NADPH:quinone reductase